MKQGENVNAVERATAPSTDSATAEWIRSFLAARGRERKAILKTMPADLDPASIRLLAPALADPSPRISHRLTALFARHGLEDEFEAALRAVPEVRVPHLRAQFLSLLRPT